MCASKDSHSVDSCVRGFHVYYDRWTPALRKILVCEIEEENTRDPYVVAIKKGSEIIGRVPRKISAACNLFLEFGGLLRCVITDTHRRYSADLPQGGLKIASLRTLRAIASCPKFEDWCQCALQLN